MLDDRLDELTVFEATEGERWLVLRLTAGREPLALDQVSYLIAVGDQRRSLADVFEPWDQGLVDDQVFAVTGTTCRPTTADRRSNSRPPE